MTDAATARHIAMLETLTDCAGAIAVTAHDLAMALKLQPDRFLALAAESRQSGFAARMGVKLIHALRAGPLPVRAPASPRAEAPERADPSPAAERDHDREPAEREGESEPASLPLFLKTLRAVAADAERRKGDLPAEVRDGALAKLNALLAEADRRPAPLSPPKPADGGVALLTRAPAASATRSTRAQLLSSTLVGGRDLRRDSG